MADIRPLSPALAKKAKEELNEDPKQIQESLDLFKSWIQKQPHLKARTTDQFLISFLRGCKHSVERAKEKLDKFYSLRSSIPELFNGRDVDDPRIMEILRLGVSLRLPFTNGEDGPRISIIRAGAYDPEKYKMHETMKIGTMIADIDFIEDDNAVIAGLLAILDMSNVTMAHFLQFDLMLMKKVVVFTEKAAPIRQKGIHFINTPPGFETIFNTMKSFMSEKQKQRLFVHGSNMESLYKHVPQKLLPVEYGGTNGTIEDIVNYWEKKLLEYRDYFKEDSQFGSDEKLRIGEPLNPDSVFGINGTFRSLNVD